MRSAENDAAADALIAAADDLGFARGGTVPWVAEWLRQRARLVRLGYDVTPPTCEEGRP